MPRMDHERAFMTYIRMVRDKIEEMVDGLPAQIAPDDAGPVRELLRTRYDRFCADMEAVRVINPPAEATKTSGKQPTKSKVARTDLHLDPPLPILGYGFLHVYRPASQH